VTPMLTNLLARIDQSKTLTYSVFILQPHQAVVNIVSGPRRYLRVFPVTGSMLSFEYARCRTTNNPIDSFLRVFGMTHMYEYRQRELHISNKP